MLAWEKKALLEGASIVIGVDEAGRGPLAGPVVAGAVILKSPDYKTRIDDSKSSGLYREKKRSGKYERRRFSA